MALLLLIAVAAGAASALLAAGVAAGAVMAVPLFYLAPLPVMIAGMAFTPLAAGIAVAVAALSLMASISGAFALTYLAGLGAPAFILSYAALLAQADPAAPGGMRWFPVAGLMLLAVALAGIGVGLGLFAVSGSYEAYLELVGENFAALVASQNAPAPQGDVAAMGQLVARMMPPIAGGMSFIAFIADLYLAGRAALISGRLNRPWPDLTALRLRPAWAGVALALLIVGGQMESLIGLVALAFATALVIAYALAGFALVHARTRGQSARAVRLAGLWIATVMLGWPLIGMAVVGIADSFLDLRNRKRNGGPPAANDR